MVRVRAEQRQQRLSQPGMTGWHQRAEILPFPSPEPQIATGRASGQAYGGMVRVQVQVAQVGCTAEGAACPGLHTIS